MNEDFLERILEVRTILDWMNIEGRLKNIENFDVWTVHGLRSINGMGGDDQGNVSFSHNDLSDMPSADNSDHDGRYFTETESDARFLKLDQSTPQTVTNGAPIFAEGIKIIAGKKVIYDG